jgi:hypothetical protein
MDFFYKLSMPLCLCEAVPKLQFLEQAHTSFCSLAALTYPFVVLPDIVKHYDTQTKRTIGFSQRRAFCPALPRGLFERA